MQIAFFKFMMQEQCDLVALYYLNSNDNYLIILVFNIPQAHGYS